MLDHIGLSVTDYEKSKAFYTKALAPLGYTFIFEVPKGHTGGISVGGFGVLTVAGSARTLSVLSGGQVDVFEGGITIGTNITGVGGGSQKTGQSPSMEFVSAGGTANNTSVSDGGLFEILGGTALGVTVRAGGTFIDTSDAFASSASQ